MSNSTPWTAARQAPLSTGFFRQESWSGSLFPSSGGLPDQGLEPGSPALQGDALPCELPVGGRGDAREGGEGKGQDILPTLCLRLNPPPPPPIPRVSLQPARIPALSRSPGAWPPGPLSPLSISQPPVSRCR